VTELWCQVTVFLHQRRGKLQVHNIRSVICRLAFPLIVGKIQAMTKLRLLPLLLLVLLGLWHSVQAAVMSIDYGTEWFKVGLIKPGIPLDIALNKDSKRKTQAVVSIRGNERAYGGDAVNLVSARVLLTGNDPVVLGPFTHRSR
jgi:hypothetical protein